MKKFIALSVTVILTGCFSAPTIIAGKHNVIIPLGDQEVGIFLPTEWENLQLPSAKENTLILSRSGTQNLALSIESGAGNVNGASVCKGARNGFSSFELISVTEDKCRFRGKVSASTPMREFLQKIVKTPKYNYFLLASCSQEIRVNDMRECEGIINSFRILDKIQ